MINRSRLLGAATALAAAVTVAGTAGAASAATAPHAHTVTPAVTHCFSLGADDFLAANVNIHQAPSVGSAVNGTGSRGSDCWFNWGQVTGQNVCFQGHCTNQWSLGGDEFDTTGYVSLAYLGLNV